MKTAFNDEQLNNARYMKQAMIREMLITGRMPLISPQMQKRDFVFAYKSITCVFDLAARPWAARKH